MPTVPAPTSSTVSPGETCARAAACIAHANGSSRTATSFDMPSGTACSWDRWATSMRAHPPPVWEQ